MFDKLEAVEKRYEELTGLISDPEMIANQAEWKKLIKEHSSIEDIVAKYREYKKEVQRMKDAEEMMEDKELKELAEVEYYEAKENLPKIEEELKMLLIPKDPNDDNNVICEIRGGAGGEEAALFAGTLFRMYSMYAERKHWKLEVLNENETGNTNSTTNSSTQNTTTSTNTKTDSKTTNKKTYKIKEVEVSTNGELLNCKKELYYGINDSYVINLQEELNIVNSCGLDKDGSFGSLTEKCVINFQKKYKLAVDGIVGKNTCNKLNSLYQAKTKYSKVVVTAEELNIREEPNTYSEILSTLKQGTIVNVYSKIKMSDGSIWYKIKRNGKFYYICAKDAEYTYIDSDAIILNTITQNVTLYKNGKVILTFSRQRRKSNEKRKKPQFQRNRDAA